MATTDDNDGGCCSTVIFNDGEVVSRHQNDKKNAALESCFSAPLECASRCDEFASDYPSGDLIQTAVEEDDQLQHENDDNVDRQVDEPFVFSADFDGAFGLMENEDVSDMSEEIMDETATPSRKVVLTDNSSPKSVMVLPKIYDGAKEQQQQGAVLSANNNDIPHVMGLTSLHNNNVTRKRILLDGYLIGDEAKPNDISLDISREDAVLAAKILEVGDAAFILRSDFKWTYAIVIDKTVAGNGQNALRFEVGRGNCFKTFVEPQWGKYVRITVSSNNNDARNKSADGEVEDPGLIFYESDSDEETLNENIREDTAAVEDAAVDLTRPKSILRYKLQDRNALDWYMKAKQAERRKIDGNFEYSVQFNMDSTSTLSDAKQDTKEDAKQPGETNEDTKQPGATKNGEGIPSSINFEEEKLKPIILFPATEISFVTPTEERSVEIRADEQSASVSRNEENEDDKGESATETTLENCLSDEKVICQDQTDLPLLDKKTLCQDPTTLTSTLECPLTPPKIDEKWDVGQLLFKLTQPVFPWPPTECDLLNNDASIKHEPSLASTPLRGGIVSNADVVEESVAIECELQTTSDVKVHEVQVTASPSAEEEEESKVDVKKDDVSTNSLPAVVFVQGNKHACQSANDLSALKKGALDIHKRKGNVSKTMRNVPLLSKRERSFKNKLMVNTISRVRSLKKSGKIDLHAINVTAVSADTFEVHPEMVG